MAIKRCVGRLFFVFLLIAMVALSGCGAKNSDKDEDLDKKEEDVVATSQPATSDKKDSDKKDSDKKDLDKKDSDKTEDKTEETSEPETSDEADKEETGTSGSGKGEILYREADADAVKKYKEIARDVLLSKYNCDENMIAEEFYADFDISDDDDRDHGVIFVGKDEPKAMYHLVFKGNKAEVLDVIDFNCSEDEVSEGAWRRAAVSKATMIDVKENTYDVGKMVYLEIPMGRGETFELLDLEDGRLNVRYALELSPTATAAVFDKDNDSIYEGFYLERKDLETLYYSIYEEFEFGAPDYKSTEGWIVLDPVPNDPEEFVMEYIKLRSIRDRERDFNDTYIPLLYVDEDGQKKSLEDRLEQMADFPFEEGYVWHRGFVEATVMQRADGEIGLTAEVDGNTAVVHSNILSGIGNGDWDFVKEYYLEKRDGQWIITGQKQLDGGSGNVDVEDKDMYVPCFMPMDDQRVDGVMRVSNQNTVTYDVQIVTEVFHHDEVGIGCHVYLAEEPEGLEDGMRVDWCVLELNNGEIYVTDWNNYADDNVSVEEYQASLLYAGGPYDYGELSEGQEGLHEYGFYVNNVAYLTRYDDSPDKDPVISKRYFWTLGEGFRSYRYGESYRNGLETYMKLDIIY